MGRIQVVIQCRLLSKRLPAKALLPIGGMPSILLCAKRASNTGLPTKIATSDLPSDDSIAELCASHGFPLVRGPSENVLARFLRALEGLPDDTIVVRLTADNPFPDGELVEMTAEALERGRHSYIGPRPPEDGLPYGLSLEAFRAGALRSAARNTLDSVDLEHVTPYLRRMAEGAVLDSRLLGVPDLSRLRCTIDTIDDYLRVRSCFNGFANPINASWKELTERLANLPDAPRFRVPYRIEGREAQSAMTLGTAQLGMPYGRTNIRGQPSLAESEAIVKTAINHGIDQIDTAPAYGESERVLGQILEGSYRERARLISKLPVVPEPPGAPSIEVLHALAEAPLFRSMRDLRVQKIGVLLLHDWKNRYTAGGALWERLKDLRDEGFVGKLGASVYEPEQALEALEDPDVNHVQLPFNILDQRWDRVAVASQGRRDVTIHARSAYLQGILLAGPETWPSGEGIDAAAWIRKLEDLTSRFQLNDRLELCIAYALAHRWIHSIVVGCDSLESLNQTLKAFNAPPLGDDQVALAREVLGDAPGTLLDPRKWT